MDVEEYTCLLAPVLVINHAKKRYQMINFEADSKEVKKTGVEDHRAPVRRSCEPLWTHLG